MQTSDKDLDKLINNQYQLTRDDEPPLNEMLALASTSVKKSVHCRQACDQHLGSEQAMRKKR